MAQKNEEQAAEQSRIGDEPETPRSPRSARQGEADEGAMEPGKGEPHETEEEEAESERGVKWSAAADNQNDGKGELSQQREVVGSENQLGFPGDQP